MPNTLSEQLLQSATPAAARLSVALDAEAQERIALLGRLNTGYIRSERHERVASAVTQIVENGAAALHGLASKRRALFILGESGSGKTTALEHTLLNRPELQPYIAEDGTEIRPLIHFEAPKPTSMKLFARKIIEATGYPLSEATKLHEYELFELAKRVLKQRKVLFVYVDEMQHVLRGNKRGEVINVADTLKSLLQIDGWPLHLIVAGMPVLAAFIEHETQLRNRSLVVSLEEVTFPADVERVRVIASGVIREHAKLSMDANFLNDEFVHRLILACEGGFGTIIQMVRTACELAIRDKQPKITVDNFVKCYQLVTGCLDHHNIFLSADWRSLSPSLPLADLVAKQQRAERMASFAATKNQREKK